MRNWILFSFILMTMALALPVAARADTVFVLENGSIRRIHGTLLRNSPGPGVSIQTNDGKVVVLKRSDIVNIVTEDTSPPMQDLPAMHSSLWVDSKSPATAMLLSLIIPGGGQFYNGQPVKGTVQLLGAIGGFALAVANIPASVNSSYISVETGNSTLFAMGVGISVASSLWSIVDAPLSAQKINQQNTFALRPTASASGIGVAARLRF